MPMSCEKSMPIPLNCQIKKYLLLVLPIFSLLCVWELIARSGAVNAYLFPPPSRVFYALGLMTADGTIFGHIFISLRRVILGLGMGSICGILVGFLTGRLKDVSKLVTPIIQVFRPLPPVAIIPLVIVWFGIGDGAKIFSIAFAVFFLVWINVHIGSERISKIHIWSARLLSGSRWKIFFKVLIPAILPFIMSGVRLGIAMSFIMVFVSELTGASSGLGYLISISNLSYRIDQMMAALLVLAALSVALDQLFVWLTNRLAPWMKLSSTQ